MKLTDEQKACRIVEAIVSDDFCEDLECRVHLHPERPIKLTQDEIKVIEVKLGTIYRLTHVANKPSCITSHNSWLQELENTYVKMRRGKLIHVSTTKSKEGEGE